MTHITSADILLYCTAVKSKRQRPALLVRYVYTDLTLSCNLPVP